MNIIKAFFSGGCTQITAAEALWQWDQGQILQIVGLDLPDAYQVEFSNQPVRGAAAPMIGGVGGVEIPDVYLTTGRDIYAFVVLHSGETDRETEYRITIHVNARPQPTDVQPTPEQQGVIDQLIAALNAGVERAEDAADEAEGSAGDAAAQAQAAAQSASSSASYAGDAAAQAGLAAAAKAGAEAAQDAAELAQGSAEEYATAAGVAKAAAETAQGEAEDAQDAAEAAQAAAESAKAGALAAKAAAETAQGKAEDAQEAAEQAAQDAHVEYDLLAGQVTAQGQTIAQHGQAIAQNTADIADLDEDLTRQKSAFNTYSAEPHWFVAGRYVKADDTHGQGDKYAYSLLRIFSFDAGTVNITSKNNTFLFSAVDRDAHTLSEWSSSIFLTPGSYSVNLQKADSSAIKSTDLADVVITTNNFDLYAHTHVEITESCNLDTFDAYCSNRKLIESGSTAGMCEYTTSKFNSYTCAFYCKKDIDFWVGRADSFVLAIFVNGALVTTVSQGGHYHIEAGTTFVLGIRSTATTVARVNVWIVVDGVKPNKNSTVSQYFSAPTYSNHPDIGCSCIVDGKVFNVSDNGTYSVTQGETVLKQGITLDHAPGHANSGNYDNGYFYVSDWTENNLIHVYAVDAENNTLSYSKDIDLGTVEDGSTEYFVFDNEKQIVSLGWNDRNSSVNPNCLVYSLWILTTAGYVRVWTKKAVRNTVLNSMVVQGEYIYYVDCNDASSSYHYININRINIATGITEYNATHPLGGILSQEIEGICPIGNGIFLATANIGRQYLISFIG